MAVSGKPRRFLIFYGNNEARLGGWGDYFRSFDSMIAALKEIHRLQKDYPREVEWWHVVDGYMGDVVVTSEDKPKV